MAKRIAKKGDGPSGRAPTLPQALPVKDPLARAIKPGDYNFSIMSSPGPAPQMSSGMTFGEIGNTGLRAFGGWVKEEFLPELQGRQGAQKYREMGDSSPVVGAIMFAVVSTMRKVEWRTIPADDSGEGRAMADFVDSCREDMNQPWTDLMVENLSMLQYGYAPHEIVYKKRMGKKPGKGDDGVTLAGSQFDDGLIGWRKIPIRGQDTILKWFFDPFGQVTGVTQLPWTGMMRDIPIEKMLLFRPSMHKGNPEGRSILRTAYVPYYFLKRLQEQEAILGERLGGIPVVRIPAAMIEAAKSDAGSAAAMQTYKQLAVNLRIDEQMGVVLPSDVWQSSNGPTSQKMFDLELVAPGGGRGASMNFETAITRYSTNIMTSVLADFLTLGHESRGTQSLATTKVDMFFQAIEGFLNSNAGVYNRYAIPRLWELNGFDPDTMPQVEPDLAQRQDLDVLSNFVMRLSQAGMPLFPNEELQTFLLDAGGLPDVGDPRALQAAGMLDDQLDLEDDKSEANLDRMQQPQPTNGQGQPGGGRQANGGGDQEDDGPQNEPQRSLVQKPQMPQSGNLEKMILASLARRMIRKAGPRFGINSDPYRARTQRRRKMAARSRLMDGHAG